MITAQLFTPAGSDLGGGQWSENPPSAAPSNLSAFFFSEETGIVGLQWVNGDTSAWIQVGFSTSGAPTSALTTLPPGTTSYDTGTTTLAGWWVRHTRGGTPGAWVGPT